MNILVDTNVLLRAQQTGHPHHAPAVQALTTLADEEYSLCVCAQNLVEFWVVVTRPQDANGFGWSREAALSVVVEMAQQFEYVPDPPDLVAGWLKLLAAVRVLGVQAHDARLVATACPHRAQAILTFNTRDFERYTAVLPLRVLDPFQILAGERPILPPTGQVDRGGDDLTPR